MKENRTKPYTNKEIFELVCERLSEKGKLPKILDYYLARSDEFDIDSYEWDIISKLDYGGSEGIYLDLAIHGLFNGAVEIINLGTFKTLLDNHEAMHIMAALHADFIIEAHRFVTENMDDFVFTGFNLDFYKDERKYFSYTCETIEGIERAYKENQKNINQYSRVVFVNNKTKESQDICNENDLLLIKKAMV